MNMVSSGLSLSWLSLYLDAHFGMPKPDGEESRVASQASYANSCALHGYA
jgi:hypothetical protein